MRIPTLLAGLCTMLLPAANTPADGPAGPDAKAAVRIARFDGDRAAAISYTFDDNTADHGKIVAPMFDEFGFHATFFVIAGTVPDTDEEAALVKPGRYGGVSWRQLKAMARKGHEIANHSWTHKNLPRCDAAALAEQIEKARAVITEKIGAAPITFCYPGNARDERVRKAVLKTHIAAREFQFELGRTDMTAAKANAWADDLVKKGRWGVTMTHGIVHGYHPFSSPQVLRDHLACVKKHEDRIWVDTFANVSRYVQERDAAKITVESKTAHEVRFVVDAPLARPPFDVPLTVIIEVGAVRKARASRAGRELPVTVHAACILVRAAPDAEPIQVTLE
jgi:peptidoglycan/xylan/chitin deacetylase (PgdA/CDA1 family)